jgi:hypothetical protein
MNTLTALAESRSQASELHRRGIIHTKHYKALCMLDVLTDTPHVVRTLQGWRYTRRDEAYRLLHERGYYWTARRTHQEGEWAKSKRIRHWTRKNP